MSDNYSLLSRLNTWFCYRISSNNSRLWLFLFSHQKWAIIRGPSREAIISYTAISKKLVGKMCTRQSRKVIWDMINILFLTTVAVEPTFVAFLYARKHIFMAFCANSFKFLWRTVNSKPPTMPFGIVACTFFANPSRKSCIYYSQEVVP